MLSNPRPNNDLDFFIKDYPLDLLAKGIACVVYYFTSARRGSMIMSFAMLRFEEVLDIMESSYFDFRKFVKPSSSLVMVSFRVLSLACISVL